MHGVLDKFIQIINENDLAPEDIEKIKAQPFPITQWKVFQENKLRTEEDYCFNAGYLLTCAAHRINPAHWQYPEVKQDARIREFRERVDISIVVDEKDYGLAKLENPKSGRARIEVVARGNTFKEMADFHKGAPEPEEFRNTDEELVKKFSDNASRILPKDKIDKAAEVILRIETLASVAELMEMVTP